MNDDRLIDFGIVEDKSKDIIKVIGVGGGGCNAVRNMYNEKISGVTLAVCNTDSKSLAPSPVPVKILLGEGLGAGGFPEIGRSEAEKNIDDIKTLLNDGTKMAFITASLGGGTGTGAAPVVASVAKEMGILTVGVVTIPFFFEKKQKIIKALKGVEELRKNVDAMLIINNERLCDVYADSNISVKESFARADNILKDAVMGIAELITVNSDGGIDLDFRDVEATTRNGGGAIMAMGRASGERRVEKAIKNALDSPLLYGNDIEKAKRILFNIYSSEETPIMVPEMQEIDEFFDRLDPDIEVIWGISTDTSLGDDVKVTILATGMDDEAVNIDNDNGHDNRYYEEIINKLYKPIKKPIAEPAEELPLEIVETVEPEPAINESEPGEDNNNPPTPQGIGGKVSEWFRTFIQDTDE
ncbi:MAG: cell division protein FtsZ [Prevotella sp.]|nr:cell division protein FtsZ [Prevotella sp.]